MANNKNDYVAQENGVVSADPKYAMEQFKNEVATSIGFNNYDKIDKGWVASRQHGYVGGNMVKKMISYAEQAIAQQGSQVMQSVRAVIEVTPEVRRMNELVSNNFTGYVKAIQSGNLAQFANNEDQEHLQ